MKKLLALILVLGVLLSLCACGAKNDANMDSGESTGESTNAATNETNENQTDPTENTIGESQNTEPEETTGATNETTTPTQAPTDPAPTDCSHEWQAATCTQPRMCAKCGKAEGHVLGHKPNKATCTEPEICTICGMVSNPASGHNWKDATYTSPKTCTVCGAIDGSPLDVPGKENYHGHVYTGGESSKKYHYEEQCAGKNSHEITWDEVERRNLGPCGTCVLK